MIETHVFCYSWPLLGASWGLLEVSWGSLGASWGSLGASWAPLGHLLGHLGGLLGPLGLTFKNHQKIDAQNDRFGPPKASQKPPKMTPKSHQKAIKNHCKKRMEKNTSSRSSWHRFGTILGRFVTALGVIFIDFLLVFKAFRENSLFAKNIVPRAVLSPTWPVLGRFWHPKSSPNASPKRLQNDQKSDQKNKTKKERKKTPNRPKT